jgi:hypothetical protein
MDELRIQKIKAIKEIVDTSIKSFVDGFEGRYETEVTMDTGVINQKKNNVFISELGEEFMFYSAFVRSFDSSFGRQLERIGNSIAKLSYDVRNGIESYILPQQKQHIDYLMTSYDNKETPQVEDYCEFSSVQPRNTSSYEYKHETDNYFYDPENKIHYVIELKAGGDLDIKKAKSEKIALLNEYFLLKNKIRLTDETVIIKFATAYNKFGEGNEWKQHQVRRYFDEKELLIGKDYWNFVCKEPNGFEIVFEQYKESAKYIKDALERIKSLYF